MRFITSSLVLVSVMLINIVTALPALQNIPVTSLTHTLHARNPNGPRVGQKFSRSQGTYWNGSNWVGNCLFKKWPEPQKLPFVAVATNLYGSATYCGTCIRVTPAGKSSPATVAIVNDQCPNCPNNGLDMSPPLYDSLMTNKAGRPGLAHFDWEVVPCPLDQGSKMQLISKDGSSEWHFSLQVAGTIDPVVRVEVKASGKGWQDAIRKQYNYWELDGGAGAGQEPDIRVTCSNGKQIFTPRVKISSDNVVVGNGNC